MSPRPILKRDPPSIIPSNPLPFATCPTLFSPKVHFPPTPTMTSTHPAFSPLTYDRAPIVVSPNVCALPERGERDVYAPADGEPSGSSAERPRGRSRTKKAVSIKGSYFNPRAYEACEVEPPAGHIGGDDADYDVESIPLPSAAIPLPPPLVQDISSSESDESDVTTPPDIHLQPPPLSSSRKPQHPNAHYHPPSIRPLNTTFASKADMNSALSFLPHPPTSPAREKVPILKEDRRKRDSTLARPCRPSLKRTTSAFAEPPLEGCLGGF